MKRTLSLLMSCALCLFAFPAYANDVSHDASEAPRIACNQVGQVWYTASVLNSNYFIGAGTVFRAGPGGTITTQYEGSKTISVQSSLTASVGINNIVQASVQAGATTAVASSTKETFTYSHDVSPNRYGNMQFGNYGWRTQVQKNRIIAPCNPHVDVSGTATLPSGVWGYRYWES